MKKLILFLFILSVFGCKKKDPTPAPTTPASTAQTNCMGTIWKYTVSATPNLNQGDVLIQYTTGDGYGTIVADTTLTSNWTKTVTITQALTGTQVSYPFELRVYKLKTIPTTTVTLHIYKGTADAVTPATAVLNTNVILQTSCN